jgi:hypothetical protein
MPRASTSIADPDALNAHLDARFANGDIERALGGFALILVAIRDESSMDAAASAMSRTLRDTDFQAVVDRTTFAVVIPQISDRATADRIIEKLQAAFGEGATNGSAISARTSVSLFPADGLTRVALMAHAQSALTAAPS